MEVVEAAMEGGIAAEVIVEDLFRLWDEDRDLILTE
jgi:hypothetical protein